MVLQLLFLMNDRFVSLFICQDEKPDEKSYKKRAVQYEFETLNHIREALAKAEKDFPEGRSVDLYAWEKLTHMNMAVLLSNYYEGIREQFKEYDLTCSRWKGEGYNRVFTELYTEDDFAEDIYRLAIEIGNLPSSLSVLVVIKRCFEFILSHKKINLSQEIGNVIRTINNIYTPICLEQGKTIDKIQYYVEIILYLRNACFESSEDYGNRYNTILSELKGKSPDYIICSLDHRIEKILDEVTMKDNPEIKVTKLKNWDNKFQEMKEQYKNKPDLSIERTMYQVEQAIYCCYKDLNGRLLQDDLRAMQINAVEDREIRKIIVQCNRKWKEFFGDQLRSILKESEAESAEEWAAILLEQGWVKKDTIWKIVDRELGDSIEEAPKDVFAELEVPNKDDKEAYEELKHWIRSNIELFRNHKTGTLLFPEKILGEISAKGRLKEEYKEIQKKLLYQKI